MNYKTHDWKLAKAQFLAAVMDAKSSYAIAYHRVVNECGQQMENVGEVLSAIPGGISGFGVRAIGDSLWDNIGGYSRIGISYSETNPRLTPDRHWGATLQQVRQETAILKSFTPEFFEKVWADSQ